MARIRYAPAKGQKQIPNPYQVAQGKQKKILDILAHEDQKERDHPQGQKGNRSPQVMFHRRVDKTYNGAGNAEQKKDF